MNRRRNETEPAEYSRTAADLPGIPSGGLLLDPARYYYHLTDQYERYARGASGWHYGIWEADTRSHHDALIRSNELLLEGLPISPASRILDVGFGSGGFAIWAARRFGCRVTGVTLCAAHVDLARRAAKARGVGELCRFLVMDMNDLAFDEAAFEVVVNQESFCHAVDKRGYLAGVRRVLAPGGWWRAIAFAVRDEVLDPHSLPGYDTVRAGFHIASFLSGERVRCHLERLGFTEIRDDDLSPKTLKTAAHIMRSCYAPLLLALLRLDWLVYSRDPSRRRNRRGHCRAAYAYSRGLRQGDFRHRLISARRP